MRAYVFASRNTKEILRDILTLFFGLAFPLVILLLLYAIGSAVPEEAHLDMFDIENLTPGITVFGLSFIALFSAQLIAKDKTTSFMMRLFTSPIKSSEFILGYTLPLIPMSLVQTLICYVTAIILGLEFTPNILLAAVVNIPIALVFIALGLLCGTVLSEKAVGGICGALLTNLSAWFSNIWFDTALVGGWFEGIANALPFAHAVNAARYALNGEFESVMPDLLWVIGYAVVLLAVAIVIFTVKMKRNK
ncbi:MAG TPA: ABC transporter permease [Ruminococcus sp.]|nr:ABC transporter permease [Ruminococcus sp.]